MKSGLLIVMMRTHSSYTCLVNLLGVKVVRLGGSRFWVWGGVVEKDRTVLYLIVGSLAEQEILKNPQ
jgi:hypothetical protein